MLLEGNHILNSGSMERLYRLDAMGSMQDFHALLHTVHLMHGKRCKGINTQHELTGWKDLLDQDLESCLQW